MLIKGRLSTKKTEAYISWMRLRTWWRHLCRISTPLCTSISCHWRARYKTNLTGGDLLVPSWKRCSRVTCVFDQSMKCILFCSIGCLESFNGLLNHPLCFFSHREKVDFEKPHACWISKFRGISTALFSWNTFTIPRSAGVMKRWAAFVAFWNGSTFEGAF